MLIDAHAHLDLEHYADDQAATIARAKAVGVSRIINVGIDPPRWNSSIALAQEYAGYIFLALGLHPTDILRNGDPDAALVLLKKTIEHNHELVVGLGETGLDYYHEDVPPAIQQIYFVKQIELARELNLPLIIHCRDAMDDLLNILADKGQNLKIMMHCFSGTIAQMQECIGLGQDVFISLAGPVTFTKALERHEIAQAVPLERLLVETDCPFLTPHPYRGKRNEPAYVRLIAEQIARLKNINYETLIEHTGANTQRLFGLM